ncbi:MAG: peptide chain release factor N(5)-glutamine methyltransferase [Bacteroidaceae bacterium]|nr:peptide chain release factor N(5)-glutamine methyltransferase [Bacteroidaceae bacterium]
MNCLQELRRHYGFDEGYALYRMVMEECFGLTHTDILLGKDSQISEENKERLSEITDRLLENEPIQYVLGYATFCGRRFAVRPGVLIPRPETEELVGAALELCATMQADGRAARVLDIGTGSGCIAVSMALAGCEATAMDISEDALAIASGNAARLNAKVSFVRENILHPAPTDNRWDIVVSNPPYVCVGEAADMERNVLDYEPHTALFVPDTDPLLFYRAIASYSLSHLDVGGALCLEINPAFHTQISCLLASFGFRDVNIITDRYGKKRIATALL